MSENNNFRNKKNKLERAKIFLSDGWKVIVGALIFLVVVGVSIKYIFKLGDKILIQVMPLLGIAMGLIVPALIQRFKIRKFIKRNKEDKE